MYLIPVLNYCNSAYYSVTAFLFGGKNYGVNDVTASALYHINATKSDQTIKSFYKKDILEKCFIAVNVNF